MNTKIEDIWQNFEEESLSKSGIILKRYSAEIIPDCFISMRMPEKVKSIAFRISNQEIDISDLNDLKDIKTEIIPDESHQGRFLILISLLDNSLTSIFAVLSEDLFHAVLILESEPAFILSLQNRFIKWKELFILVRSSGISPERQIGLFGEIFFLKKLIAQTNKIKDSLTIWSGPDNGIRDFEKDRCAIEVKTTKTHNQQKVHISNERQLDTTLLDDLFLFHLSVEQRNSEEYSLNTLVDELFSMIGDNKNCQNLFLRKLTNAGYFEHHRPQYQNISFLIRDEEFFDVKDDFPRIEEKDLMKGVGDVKYSIVFSSETEKYKTNLNQIIQKLEFK
ncbi:MAG: PD-(D/E)XK motif protein [Prolixibacteraceae bacterium]